MSDGAYCKKCHSYRCFCALLQECDDYRAEVEKLHNICLDVMRERDEALAALERCQSVCDATAETGRAQVEELQRDLAFLRQVLEDHERAYEALDCQERSTADRLTEARAWARYWRAAHAAESSSRMEWPEAPGADEPEWLEEER